MAAASSIEKEPLLKDDENKGINKKKEKGSSEATNNNAKMTAKSSAERSQKSKRPAKPSAESMTATYDVTQKSKSGGRTGKDGKNKEKERQSAVAAARKEERRAKQKNKHDEYDIGPYSYLISFAYLFVLWTFTAIFAGTFVYLLYLRCQSGPIYYGEGSLIGGTPYLVFEPNPTKFPVNETIIDRTTIVFNSKEAKSYENHLIRYKHIMKGQRKKPSRASSGYETKAKSCPDHTAAVKNKHVCQVERNSSEYGPCTFDDLSLENTMGFSIGQPCIMLKFTKIIGWTLDGKGGSKDCKNERILVSCKAEPRDLTVTVYPVNGIDTCSFPYKVQPEYQTPYLMAHLQIPKHDTQYKVTCKPVPDSLKKTDSGKDNAVEFKVKRISAKAEEKKS